MTEVEIKIIFEQIAHAILVKINMFELTHLLDTNCFCLSQYLHTKGYVHRDIKMENVIVCDRERLYVKLSDFGLSALLKEGEALFTSCGTIMYGKVEMEPACADT